MQKSWGDYDDKSVDWIHGEGSAVVQVGFLLDFEMEYGKWHRSKDKKFKNPFNSAMINKKWWLEEDFNNLVLQIHQVDV